MDARWLRQFVIHANRYEITRVHKDCRARDTAVVSPSIHKDSGQKLLSNGFSNQFKILDIVVKYREDSSHVV